MEQHAASRRALNPCQSSAKVAGAEPVATGVPVCLNRAEAIAVERRTAVTRHRRGRAPLRAAAVSYDRVRGDVAVAVTTCHYVDCPFASMQTQTSTATYPIACVASTGKLTPDRQRFLHAL